MRYKNQVFPRKNVKKEAFVSPLVGIYPSLVSMSHLVNKIPLFIVFVTKEICDGAAFMPATFTPVGYAVSAYRKRRTNATVKPEHRFRLSKRYAEYGVPYSLTAPLR